MADFTIKQGDTLPVLDDTLTYDDGNIVDLSAAAVSFVMRARSQTAPAVNAAAIIDDALNGHVFYAFTTTDSATAGEYEAYWLVVFPTGDTQRFPTVGYLTVEIQENLETPNQTIVELGDLKAYLNMQPDDRAHDAELLRFLAATVPVIENLTGPVLPRVYQNETYDGGYTFVSLRHRPVIEVHRVVEYRGNIEYELQQVPTPAVGTIYSYMFEPPGRIVRRTVGGGATPFPSGYDQVFVTYTAGYKVIPANIQQATLELVRDNYQQTQQAGRPAFGGGGFGADENLPAGPSPGFFVPNRVRELLAPSKRHPSVA